VKNIVFGWEWNLAGKSGRNFSLQSFDKISNQISSNIIYYSNKKSTLFFGECDLSKEGEALLVFFDAGFFYTKTYKCTNSEVVKDTVRKPAKVWIREDLVLLNLVQL
jgi:hypothetical protein